MIDIIVLILPNIECILFTMHLRRIVFFFNLSTELCVAVLYKVSQNNCIKPI